MGEFKIDKISSENMEPLRKNRFVVEFPKKYQIPQWVVRRFMFNGDGTIELKIMEIVGSNYSCRISGMPKIGELNIKLLDPTNYPILNIGLTKVKITDIIPDILDYKDDGVLEFTLKCKYGKITYGSLY